VVYKARHQASGRVVALKMILSGALSSPADRERFQAEVQSVAALRHPGIVTLYEVGTAPAGPFYTMEYVEGGSLGDCLDGTPLPPAAAAQLVHQLAEAIHAAHLKGIVHRDLKPANVLLQGTGDRGQGTEAKKESVQLFPVPCPLSPKIADFGLARRMDVSGHTATGAIVGTPSYMAPEQAASDRQAVGPPSDVYALGAILYELLTGRPPFKGPTPLDTVLQVLHDEPVAPTQLQPRTPADLEGICLKCLEKDPRRRYATAQALAEDLRRFQNGEPTLARPVGRVERARRWAWRNPWWSAALALAALTLLVGTGLATWQAVAARLAADQQKLVADEARLKEENQRLAAQQAQSRAVRAADQADKALTQAKHELRRFDQMHYLDNIRAADKALLDNDFVTARLRLDECRWDLRSVEHAYLRRQLAQKAPRELLGHAGGVNTLVASPDGKRLFSVGSDKAIKVWDAEAGKEITTLFGHGDEVTCLALSADGKRLYSGSADKTIKVWDLEAGKEILTLRGHQQGVRVLALAPDGRRLFSASAFGGVKAWDLEAGKETHLLEDHLK
jgi:tRNA A-37 threonylcarbamoyl transferase component Bud32